MEKKKEVHAFSVNVHLTGEKRIPPSPNAFVSSISRTNQYTSSQSMWISLKKPSSCSKTVQPDRRTEERTCLGMRRICKQKQVVSTASRRENILIKSWRIGKRSDGGLSDLEKQERKSSRTHAPAITSLKSWNWNVSLHHSVLRKRKTPHNSQSTSYSSFLQGPFRRCWFKSSAFSQLSCRDLCDESTPAPQKRDSLSFEQR